MKRTFQYVAAAALAYCALLNLSRFNTGAADAPPRHEDQVTVMEAKYLPIHWELKEENYRGDLAHATARSFRGEKRTELDEVHYAQLRYVTVPLNLVPYPSDALWILGDFTSGEAVPEPPPGIVKVYDPGTGLVLYKREPQE